MQLFTQDNVLPIFLLFGIISSIFVVLSTIFKFCRLIYTKLQTNQQHKIQPNTPKQNESVLQSTDKNNSPNQIKQTNTNSEEDEISTQIRSTSLHYRRSKSDNIQQYIPDIPLKQDHKTDNEIEIDDQKYESPLLILKRRHSLQHTHIKRRFSTIANYYEKYKYSRMKSSPLKNNLIERESSVESDDSLSPMSVINYPNRSPMHQQHEQLHIHDAKDHITLRGHFSATTTIFEDIMMNTTVLDGIRVGKLHDVLHECSANDIANFFPVIAAIICKIPYGMKNEQNRLLQLIKERALNNCGLRQTIQFFMLSNVDNELVQQIWRHNAFMIALESSKRLNNLSIDDNNLIPSTHHKLKRKKSSAIIRHKAYGNYNDIKRRKSFTTDDMNEDININDIINGININDEKNEEIMSELNMNVNRHKRRKFTRSYIESFADNTEVFRWMLDSPVGCQYETVSHNNGQEICDPINRNEIIYKMEVKKIFQSAARPVLVETFNKNLEIIGEFILKEGDDLRQDENMMFMFHIMNAIWEEHQLEYNSHPIRALTYLCVAMSNDFGAIELVENCIPLRNIATLKNKFETNQHLLNNLIASTVGAYIAAYIMGVGDRHFDNILIRDDGTLFHIDFGYILGRKLSIDTSEFAITNDLYMIIIGQEGEEVWQEFIEVCVDAFMILRKHIDELIQFGNICFTFMETQNTIDKFFNQIFAMDLMDKEVEILLRNKLEQAPFNFQTRIKNTMHLFATASWYPKNLDLSVMKQLSLVSSHILTHDDYFSDGNSNPQQNEDSDLDK